MDTVLALSDFHPRDRLAYWYDVACKVFVKHNCQVQQPSSFDVTMDHGALGDLGVASIETIGLTFAEVTKRTIAAGEDDVFFLCLQLSGTGTFNQDGRETTIRPGDFVLLDAQRPYTCNYAAAWKQIIIKIPHRSLKARLGASSELTAHAVRHADGIGGLASGYMRMLPGRIDSLRPAAKIQIAEHVLDLAAMSLTSAAGKDRPAVSSGRALTLLQLRMAIENRLGEPGLDPQTAAAAAGISVRYANTLLSAQGTSLERLIVSRRLDHCRQALEDPAQANRTITDIAFGWGFHDASHFNRRFKAEFGCSPSDYRRRFRA
jgi:AraC-like DNA-binding protein